MVALTKGLYKNPVMDKLRAIEYFLASAEERSFTRAAARLEVSVPAIAKLVGALERKIGITLFDRSARGLVLTSGGERYLEACRPLLEQLNAADQLVGQTAQQRGTLVIGAHPELVLLPWFSRFHARYPDLVLDVRPVNRRTLQDVPADVYLVHGWPEQPDLILKRIAKPRLQTCASPEYWATHGVPQRPQDLEQHSCLLYCNDEGIVNDLWQYERDGITESVTARGWLVSNHRQLTINAALAGEGVVRASDLLSVDHLRSGRLVPVLLDWVMQDVPPINLLYKASQRRNPRVRLFMDFMIEAFRDIEAEFGVDGRREFAQRPFWAQRRIRRASTATRAED